MRIHLMAGIRIDTGQSVVGGECLPGRLGRVAFAYLAAGHRRPIGRAELAAALWADALPPTWEKGISVLMSKLRSALSAAQIDGREVLTNAFGCYQLRLAEGTWVDVVEADRAVCAAEAALATGSGADAVCQAALAAEITRQEFLPGEEGDWVVTKRGELGQLLARSLDCLGAAYLLTGNARGAVQSARELVALEPYRESAYVLLMRAYAAAGDRSEALRVHEQCRSILSQDLGIDPGPATEGVHLEILRARLDEVDFPALRVVTPDVSNLPASPDEFVGRDRELAQVRSSLQQHRLVTLTGPGGSGKSRLAFQVAAGFVGQTRNGVWLVDLATETDARRIVPMTASVLQIGDQPRRPLQATLEHALASRDLLLVLDNCEHLLDGVATFVTALISKSPNVRLLTTSREPLGVRGEVVHRIPPLSLADSEHGPECSDAVRLFTLRARAANPALDPDPTAMRLIADVCRRLDGLPLAIELAAARLRALSLAEVAARLDDRFRILIGGPRSDPPRHRTLEAVVSWSYDLLHERERELFRRVAVFPDSFTTESAEAVGSVGRGHALDLLSRLVDKSLINGVDGPAGFRYQLLETLRQYGRERLANRGEAAVARDRLLAWAMTHVDRLDEAIRTPTQDAALRAVTPELANIRSAMRWAIESGRHLEALQIVVAVPVGLDGERRELIAQLLRRTVDPPQAVLARAHLTGANLAFDQADWTATTVEAGAALAACTAMDDRVNAAWANYFAILGFWGRDDTATVRELVPSTLEAFRRLAIPLGEAYILWVASQHDDELETADRLADEGAQAFRVLGSPFGLGHTLEGRALIRLRGRDIAAARGYLADALAIYAAASNLGCVAHCLEAVAAVAARIDGLDQTAELLGAAETLRELSGQGHRPWERAAHRQSVEALRRGADPSRLEAARMRGRARTMEAAITFAEQVLGQEQPAGASSRRR